MGLLLGSGNTKPQYPYDQWYGVQGDFNSQDYKLKRVGNLDLHRTLPIQAKPLWKTLTARLSITLTKMTAVKRIRVQRL